MIPYINDSRDLLLRDGKARNGSLAKEARRTLPRKSAPGQHTSRSSRWNQVIGANITVLPGDRMRADRQLRSLPLSDVLGRENDHIETTDGS